MDARLGGDVTSIRSAFRATWLLVKAKPRAASMITPEPAFGNDEHQISHGTYLNVQGGLQAPPIDAFLLIQRRSGSLEGHQTHFTQGPGTPGGRSWPSVEKIQMDSG